MARGKNRINFYPTDEVEFFIKTHSINGKPKNLSRLVSEAISRYHSIVRSSIPDLSGNEWMFMFAAINAEASDDMAIRLTKDKIVECVQFDNLDKKFGIDGNKIIKLIGDMPFHQLVALHDVVERYWLTMPEGCTPETVHQVMRIPRSSA